MRDERDLKPMNYRGVAIIAAAVLSLGVGLIRAAKRMES
jgi:hypothetical protein